MMKMATESEWYTISVRKPIHQALKILLTYSNIPSYNDLIIALLKSQEINKDPDILNIINKLINESKKYEEGLKND
ncbi:MAG: hypothetical protein ACP5L4_06990 [Thermoplasmata archaeon]